MVWNIFHWCHDNSNFIFYVKVLIRHYRDKLTITPIKMIVGSSLFTFSLTTSCSSSSHKTSNSHNHTPFEFWNQALQSTRQLRKIGGKKQQGAITCQQQILLMQEKAFLEAASTALFPTRPSIASDKLQPDYKVCLS